MSIHIEESGLTFGPFAAEDCFELERSATYRRINSGNAGIKVCEFALIRRPANRTPLVWLVEAKSSSPRPGNQQDFDAFIEEIRQKLSNALQMLVAACLERHPEAATEQGNRAMPPSTVARPSVLPTSALTLLAQARNRATLVVVSTDGHSRQGCWRRKPQDVALSGRPRGKGGDTRPFSE